MVRVFKCHSFASQKVIQVDKEPLTVCADEDKVFVATNDCEIIVFQVSAGTPQEIHRFPTVSLVERVLVNSFKSCIITTELRKSWKGLSKSVRVYLNWEYSGMQGTGKQRAKVRVAGKSHIQHTSSTNTSKQVEVVEVPVDGAVSSIAVCNWTGNFAIACGSEVKLCSLVEKMIANTDRTYLDVEVFLELCWSFPVESISLCEEFVVCCCLKEVQGIRVRYDEGDRASLRDARKLLKSPSASFGSTQDGSHVSSTAVSPRSFSSEIMMFQSQTEVDEEGSNVDGHAVQLSPSDISSVGMRTTGRSTPKSTSSASSVVPETRIVEDTNFVEWNFLLGGSASSSSHDGGHAVCLPGLHTSSSQSQCHRHIVSPPVLSDFSGGKVKSSSGVQAETVLHLSDPRGQEEWMCVTLVPSHSADLPTPLCGGVASMTDRMRASSTISRTSMCCYISGSRGGCLYQLSPHLSQISLYKYTDQACQVGVSESFLHIVTQTGIETYTSRWGAVSLEMRDGELGEKDLARPSSGLDICLVGHEPFFGAACLSMGSEFLVILSKVEEDSRDKEAHWGLYILHSFSVVDLYRDLLNFATNIQETGPASYIHVLQEAHLLLSSHRLHIQARDAEIEESLRQVCRLIAEYYAQPGQSEWELAWPYYRRCGASIQDVVSCALGATDKKNPQEFGQGLIDYLDHELFTQDEYLNIASKTCNTILDIYAVAAPDKLSKVILLSNASKYSPEIALRHLKTWLAVKASSEQVASPLDQLALVQVNLQLCEVETACEELRNIPSAGLTEVCADNPALLHENLSSFTPLAQLMRQHLAGTLLEALVKLLDRGAMSLDSLLLLLKNQGLSDSSHNNHSREILELIVANKKRAFLFDEAANLLCKAYITRIKDKSQLTYRQITAAAHHKFSLPQGDGHFAPRYAWLDELPPFMGNQHMTRLCQRIEVKVKLVAGGGSKIRAGSHPVAIVKKQQEKKLNEICACCRCNESLLKLQSMLCSSYATEELAESILEQMDQGHEVKVQDGHIIMKHADDTAEMDGAKAGTLKSQHREESCLNDHWDSVRLLCFVKTNLYKAIEMVVEKYPAIAGSFGVCCFGGDVEKFTHLMRSLEAALKSGKLSQDTTHSEEVYAKAYKGLLWRLTELLSPVQLVEILPPDANLFFLLPFLSSSLEQAHRDKLKNDIVDMGQQLMKGV